MKNIKQKKPESRITNGRKIKEREKNNIQKHTVPNKETKTRKNSRDHTKRDRPDSLG
jgi:hypothetical protein